MKGKDCHTSARTQSIRKLLHKFIQYFELMVNINTQCLEGSLAGLFDGLLLLFFRKKIQSLLDHFPKFRSGIYAVALTDLIGDGFGDLLTVRLIGIFIQHSGKFFSGNGIQTLGCTDAGFLIQAQIQRSVCFKRETSFGVINLHG